MSQAFDDRSLMATDVIAYLRGKYQVDEAVALAVAEDRLNYNPFPLYLRILISVGAVVSGGLLMSFLGIAGLFNEAMNLLVVGIAMLGVAIGIHLRSRHTDQATASFVAEQQLSFLGVFTGKILIVAGASELGEAGGAFMAILAFTLATYWVYDMYLDRLASCAGTLIAGIFLCFDEFHLNEESIGIVMHLAVPLGLAIYLHPRIKQAYNPLAIALIGVAAGYALVTMTNDPLTLSPAKLLMSLITCCSLIGLVAWACGSATSFGSRYVRATIGLTLLLGLACMTPTMIGLIVIILGYVCHDRLITLVGAIFLPVTLWIAIHSLEMGLMTTGVVLVLISLVLLSGYFLFRYWSFGDRSESDTPDLAGEGIPHA